MEYFQMHFLYNIKCTIFEGDILSYLNVLNQKDDKNLRIAYKTNIDSLYLGPADQFLKMMTMPFWLSNDLVPIISTMLIMTVNICLLWHIIHQQKEHLKNIVSMWQVSSQKKCVFKACSRRYNWWHTRCFKWVWMEQMGFISFMEQ